MLLKKSVLHSKETSSLYKFIELAMENTLGPLLVLTALLGNGVLPVMADGRSVAVYQFGTTLDPHFRRVEG